MIEPSTDLRALEQKLKVEWTHLRKAQALDEGKRKHLETLNEEHAGKDEIYQEARHLTHTFRDGLLAFFFDPKSEMDVLTKTYGVF